VVTPGADILSWAADVGFSGRRDTTRYSRCGRGAGRGGKLISHRIVIGNALPATSNRSALGHAIEPGIMAFDWMMSAFLSVIRSHGCMRGCRNCEMDASARVCAIQFN
jgi:hypothetical protein